MPRPPRLLILLLLTPCFAQPGADQGARLDRSPQQVTDALLQHYGKDFKGSYLQALSLVVRCREQGAPSVAPIVEPALISPAAIRNGSQVAGQLIFAELAKGDARAKARVINAAELGFDPGGKPLTAMPFHNEMSDAVFMSCPLLGHAGRLSGETKYLDQAVRHLHFIQSKCLRDDGLYRHSPLCEAAWGRGNGFPAIGVAMLLETMPATHPQRPAVIAAFQKHMAALKPHQDKNGMWHQVIDKPESYAEFTCTCMIGYAAQIGMKHGWLEREAWTAPVEQARRAIWARISLDGREVYGACTGTGKQKSLEAYFQRKEINGRDERGGAMALLFASSLIQ